MARSWYLPPAGTGKTRIMADRLAAVIAVGMPPEKTLGVTFTNRAAEHMRSAVAKSCGAHAKDCRKSLITDHSALPFLFKSAFQLSEFQLLPSTPPPSTKPSSEIPKTASPMPGNISHHSSSSSPESQSSRHRNLATACSQIGRSNSD